MSVQKYMNGMCMLQFIRTGMYVFASMLVFYVCTYKKIEIPLSLPQEARLIAIGGLVSSWPDDTVVIPPVVRVRIVWGATVALMFLVTDKTEMRTRKLRAQQWSRVF